MTMWVGIYTRVSPFTLVSILYHRPSWMSSVCDKLFERKTGTPIARSPSSNTQEVQLWSSRLSPSLMTTVSYHRFAILSSVFVKVFEKVFWGSGDKEPPPLVHVYIYAYVCVYVCVCTHRHTQAHMHRRPQTHDLWHPSDPFSKGRWREGATGAGWWSIGLRMTPLFWPSFWPLILTLKIDRSRWQFKGGAKRRTKANEVSLKNCRHKNY